MLWRKPDDFRFVYRIRKKLCVAKRKPVVPPSNDVQQFVARIATREPGIAFLIGGKQIAMPVKFQPDNESQSRRQDFAFPAIR